MVLNTHLSVSVGRDRPSWASRPVYLQSALGMSALRAGLTVAPMPLVLMVVSPFAGRLADGTAAVDALLQNRLAAVLHDQTVPVLAQVAPALHRPFVEDFIAAMRPTLVIPIALLVLTALAGLVMMTPREKDHGAP